MRLFVCANYHNTHREKKKVDGRSEDETFFFSPCAEMKLPFFLFLLQGTGR